MKVKKGELKVFYGGKLNKNFDRDLEAFLKKYGYTSYASCYNIPLEIRNLTFDKREDKESKTS